MRGAVHGGQAHRTPDSVEVLGPVALQAAEVKSVEDAQGQQELETLARRPRHVHGQVAIGRRNRPAPAGDTASRSAIARQPPSDWHMRHQLLAEPAAIQVPRPCGSDRLQRRGEVGLAEHLAVPHAARPAVKAAFQAAKNGWSRRAPAAWLMAAAPKPVSGKPSRARPMAGASTSARVLVPCALSRPYQPARPPGGATAMAPGRSSSRCRTGRPGSAAAPRRAKASVRTRRSPATQQVAMPSPASPDMAGSTTPERRGGGHRRVEGIAAAAEHARPGGGGERVGGRDHAVARSDGRAIAVHPGLSLRNCDVAFAARIGAAGRDPGLRVDRDGLQAAHQVLQSGAASTSWPRPRSASRPWRAMRLSASTRRPSHSRARGASMASCDGQAEIDVLHQRLRLRLADAVTAGRAQQQHRRSPLVAIEGAIGSANSAPATSGLVPARVELAPVEEIVEADAGAGHHDAAAEQRRPGSG